MKLRLQTYGTCEMQAIDFNLKFYQYSNQSTFLSSNPSDWLCLLLNEGFCGQHFRDFCVIALSFSFIVATILNHHLKRRVGQDNHIGLMSCKPQAHPGLDTCLVA